MTPHWKRWTLTAAVAAACWAMMPAADAGAQTLTEDQLKAFTYRSIGPTRQSGRFVDIAVPSQEPYTIYAATGSGGLYKSVNAGTTWESIFDFEAVFSIGDVTVAPSNPDIVWVGTGEANTSRSMYWGDGVYKSTDAGETWTNMGLPESHHIGRILVHPTNPDVVYVAAMGHLYSENPERGLYKTTNGGRTWDKALEVIDRGKHIGIIDAVMDPTNPDVIYAAAYDKVRKPYTFNLGGPGGGIYKTTDGGDSWTKLGGGLPGGMLGRIGIDVYLRDPNIVYANVENANKEEMSDEERYQELLGDQSSRGMIDGEVYRSDDAGMTWRKVSPDDQSIGGGPGYYYAQLRIDPNDDQVVHVLSASSWGTRNGGEEWLRRPLNFGGDDHALWIDPDNSDHIILGYDHGLGITYDGGATWQHTDQLSLAQFYAVGADMSYPYRVAGGIQENGSQMGPSTKPGGGAITLEDWDRVGGGDGMYNVFDQCNNRYLYNESQFGPLSRLDLLTGERESIRYQDPELRVNWNAPILVSQHDCATIYHSMSKLLKSTNRGESWEVISPDLTKADPATLTTGKGGDGNIQYGTITTMDESSLDANVLWVGTDDGNVQVTRDGGDNWTLVNDAIPNNPEYWVTRVEASNHLPGTAYVSFSGMRRDEFRAYVYKTTDYGETWTSIKGNLPEEPVNVIREDHRNSNLLFLGTDFAVYVSIDGGGSWTKMKVNMPTQPVYDMLIHSRENDLVVATHGRGIYIADISALQEMDLAMEHDAYFFQPESKPRWYDNDFANSSSQNFAGESEPDGIVAYYYVGEGVAGDVKISVYQGGELINEYEGSSEAGVHSVLWNMTERQELSEAQIEQRRTQTRRFAQFGRGQQGDPRFSYSPARLGEYTFVLTVGDLKFERRASILKDPRFEGTF